MKNFIPLGIVLGFLLLGGLGLYIMLNQNVSSKNLDLNSTSNVQPLATIPPASNNQTQGNNAQAQNNAPVATDSSQVVSTQTLEDGLVIEDLKIGEGQAVKSGDTISIHYLGTLTNGQKFDSSYDRGQPFVTQIGVGQVIKGWDEGVIGMKVGGKRRLIIPADLGYGSQAVGGIPANSTLIFEVELMGIN